MNANAFNYRGHGGNGEIIDPSTLLRAGNGQLTLRLRSGQESLMKSLKEIGKMLIGLIRYVKKK
jgi:hypothetical protein